MAKTVDNGTLTDYDVATGAGVVDADVQRVTLASDDPAVVALQALDNAIAGSEMQVDVVTMPTVTVQDGGGSLTVDGTVAVTGTFWQATQPVSGTVTANAGSGTFTVAGAVTNTVLSVVGGGTEATAQRVTIASDSTGVLSVDDNGGSLTVDGTVAVSGTVAVTDNAGSLTVDAPVATPVFVRLSDGSSAITTLPVSLASVPSHAVTNAGTFVTQENGAALTSLQLLDDSIVADDAAFTPGTTKVSMAGFEYDDTTPDSVNEGDAGAARMSANRNQYVQIRDNAGNERGLNVAADGSIAVTVATIPSHAVTNAGTFAVQDSEKIADNAGFTDGTTKVLPTGYVYDEVAGTSLTENDIAAARIDAKRAQVLVLEDGTTRGQKAAVSAAGRLSVDGSGVTQPVSGTVTANLAAGTNAIGKLAANSGVTIGAVEIAAAQTLATVTTVGAVTSITNALPAGTNAIGKLAANSGVDIGDVDVTSVVPGTSATSLGKAVDSAAGATDTGVASLLVRDDVLTTQSPVDGDWVPGRSDKAGATWVRDRNAGTATLSNVSSSATTASLLASNTDRLGVIAVNDSTATQYIKYGTTASTTSYTYQIPPGATWEMPAPIFTGAIDYISSAASGTIRVTELS